MHWFRNTHTDMHMIIDITYAQLSMDVLGLADVVQKKKKKTPNNQLCRASPQGRRLVSKSFM